MEQKEMSYRKQPIGEKKALVNGTESTTQREEDRTRMRNIKQIE